MAMYGISAQFSAARGLVFLRPALIEARNCMAEWPDSGAPGYASGVTSAIRSGAFFLLLFL